MPMINQVYQLVAPRQFDVTYNNVDIYGNHVIVRPLYLSICAADQSITQVEEMKMYCAKNYQCH